MPSNWAKVIQANMEPLAIMAGEASTIYKPREKAFVWILTEIGDFPSPPPPLERHELIAAGGREITLDIADPDFLVVQRLVGETTCIHYIPWGKIVDLVFRHAA
jgi:hypothetical protein